MSHEIFMPALSSTMTEGKIVEWLKNPGDKVERGESVLVVESDKADMDVESFQDGYLAAVLMPAGSTAPVGETIGLIVENEDEIASVQEQNKGNQPEVSTSDQLELVSNNTEEKPVVQTENIKKEAEEVVLTSEKPVPSFNVDQINAATSNVSSRIIASPRAKKLFPEVSGLLSTPKFAPGTLAGEPPSPIHGIETGWPLAFKISSA